jgi:MFS family permease
VQVEFGEPFDLVAARVGRIGPVGKGDELRAAGAMDEFVENNVNVLGALRPGLKDDLIYHWFALLLVGFPVIVEAMTNFDKTRRACYTGYITQAIVNNLAPLLFIVFQTRYHISYEMLGRLVLLNFAVQLTTDFVVIQVVDRIGYRKPLVLAHVLCMLGLILLAVLPSALSAPYLGLCLAIVVYAIGGGLLEVLVSPVVEALPSPEEGKAAAMSLLHSFYCWGQVGVVLGTTLLLAQIGHAAWPVLPLVWALIPLANMVAFLRVPLPPAVPDEQRTTIRTLFKTSAFGMALVLMLCAGAAELTMSQWSSLFAEQGLDVPEGLGRPCGPVPVRSAHGNRPVCLWPAGRKDSTRPGVDRLWNVSDCLLSGGRTRQQTPPESGRMRAVWIGGLPDVAGNIQSGRGSVSVWGHGHVRDSGLVRRCRCSSGSLVSGCGRRCSFPQSGYPWHS